MRDLNLIPPKYYQQELMRRKKRNRLAVIMLTVVAWLALSALLQQFNQTLKQEKAAWDDKLANSSSYYKAGQELDYIKALCEQRTVMAKSLDKSGLDVPALMWHIEQSAPPQLIISKLNVTEGKEGQLLVMINGFLSSETEIKALVYHLEKDVYFDSVNLSSAKQIDAPQEDSQMINFIVNLRIDSGK